MVCSLCLERVSGELWSSGEHRSVCASRNTAKLSTFPSHPSVSCARCKGRLRLWPNQGAMFSCDSPDASCPHEDSARLTASHQNRWSCFLCDYNVCKLCVQMIETERMKRKESSRQLVSCLKNMCDRVKERVNEDTSKQASFDSFTSIMLDTDDIPLIDDQASAEDNPTHLKLPEIQAESFSEAPNPPDRRSVVSNTQNSDQSQNLIISTNLPKKPSEFSPDVFQLRAPLGSWENFMTPATSLETVVNTWDVLSLD